MHDAPQTDAAARLDKENPLGVDGFEFVEFTGPDPAAMVARLELMGFTQTHVNPANDAVRLKQGDITLLVHRSPRGQAGEFATEHGPSANGMAFRVAEPGAAREDPAEHVELGVVFQHLGAGRSEPRAVADAECQREPVRDVHEALVGDIVAGDPGDQSVVDAGDVGPGVVDTVGHALGGGAAGGEVPVPEHTEGLAVALPVWIETLVDEQPIAHPSRLSSHPDSSRRNSRTSRGFPRR